MKNKQNESDLAPSREELNSLLILYQRRSFVAAEKLALSFTSKFPKHHLAVVVDMSRKQMHDVSRL